MPQVLFPIGNQDHYPYPLLSSVFVISCQPFLFDNLMISDVSGGLCSSLFCCLPDGSGQTWSKTADDISSCCVANVRRIIVTLCDVKCQANGGKAMENVRRYRLSQSLYCKSVGVVATSLAQSQFLWKSAHCSPHLIIYTCGICTCMHVHAHAQMDLRSLKFKIIPLMIQDLLAVCLEHCCAMLFSPF